MKTGGVYLGFHTSGGRKFPHGNFRTTRVLRSQNTDCRKNEVFRQSHTACRRNASFATAFFLLLAEDDLAGLRVHTVHDGERLEMVAEVADGAAAVLEALLDGDADALDRAAGLLNDGDQTLKRVAVGQKIVDEQHVIVSAQEFLGDDDLILALVRKGLDLCDVNVAIDVDALRFLRKNDRYAEMTCDDAGNADAGGLDRHDLVDVFIRKAALELLAHLVEQLDIHLMIEKAVNLEHVALLDHAVFYDAFL